MPASHHIDDNNKLILTTWEGEAVDIDFIDAIKKYQKDIQNKPEYLDYNEIVNFIGVTNIRLTTEGIKHISEIASATDQHGANRKLAFVTSSSLAFGLARMYVVYRNFSAHASKEIRVFKNENNALEWIKLNT